MLLEGHQVNPIDALLDAALPHHGGLAIEAALVDVSAAQGMAFGPGAFQHAMFDQVMVAHVDAAQTV